MNLKAGDIFLINESDSKIIIDLIEDEKRVYYHLMGEGNAGLSNQIMTIALFEKMIELGEIIKF